MEALKKNLRATKEENKKLKAQRIIESPDRERRRHARRLDSDHESDMEMEDPGKGPQATEMDTGRGGAQAGPSSDQATGEPLPPVFRPPLMGVI